MAILSAIALAISLFLQPQSVCLCGFYLAYNSNSGLIAAPWIVVKADQTPPGDSLAFSLGFVTVVTVPDSYGMDESLKQQILQYELQSHIHAGMRYGPIYWLCVLANPPLYDPGGPGLGFRPIEPLQLNYGLIGQNSAATAQCY